MIWVVSKSICKSENELISRHEYIENVTQTRVSPWVEYKSPVGFFQCRSLKGEYGIIVTAHCDEVKYILQSVLRKKRALVIINSCTIDNSEIAIFTSTVKFKNRDSLIFFAKQDEIKNSKSVVYDDDCGSFGFKTTVSERELFMYRRKDLVKAINQAYERNGTK